ncbi:hypothetical protein [Pontibacter virosus]|uniref:PH (Pleckstrin Homology) domain-containing protein n=1 Tax=Pontibacter virosus TaxID=1765052 RepID=A0A2U1B5Y7_9BACT|nr:hypothetical protein [Pontibacter virosus]PVY44094.1 hypothetical protein C8E01_101458 [Pontibacter virosus]
METPLLRYRLTDPAGFTTKVYATIIIAGGVWVCMTYPVVGVIMILFGIFPLVQYKCLEIDLYSGTYCMGINILGRTVGTREPYPGTKCIFLKKNRYFSSNSRRSWRPTASTSFDSFLWLEDGTKILLSRDGNKEDAMARIQPLAQELQTEIKDLTAPLSQI